MYDTITDTWSRIIPYWFPFNNFQTYYHWLFLGCFLLLAPLAFSQVFGRLPNSAREFLGWVFPKRIYLHKSALRGYRFYFVNEALKVLLGFASLILSMAAIQALVHGGMTKWLGSPAATIDVAGRWEWMLLYTFVLFIMNDLAVFGHHYLAHKVPFLWEFHKIHHSSIVLTPIEAFREHPMDQIGWGTVWALLIGTTNGIFNYYSTSDLVQISIWGSSVMVIAMKLVANLRHSHLWLQFPRPLRLISSPAQHQIHHSKAHKHYDKNFGFYLNVWDWLLGTLYQPSQYEEIDYGLKGDEEVEYDSVWQLYWLPFVKAARLFRSHGLRAMIPRRFERNRRGYGGLLGERTTSDNR